MSGSERDAAERMGAGAHTVLRVLEKKAYFKHRFLEQVQALYRADAEHSFPMLPASLYVTALFARVPEAIRSKVADLVSKRIVDSFEYCPTPVETRTLVAEATLAALEMSFEQLAERAKLFTACPPTEQAVADRWTEQVIFTTLSRIGRDRFVSTSPAEWKDAVSQTILGDADALRSYQVPRPEAVSVVRKNFRELLPKV
ncbi:hypothetical protein [Burkholderia ubonensis]|uniref:hypothetical protein n=1 Tax=Burkholderia ubonensis TaxID=101571 RepID=UPI0007520EE8|nr:hypothetical protein [Burkholderia ubonensis]KVV07474.1 hypothetical protein WK77_16950 [Burkholderia ubonensis]